MKKTFNLGGVTITVECEEQPKRQTVAPHRCVCNHVVPTREPDGIDAHIDRPVRENYGWFEDARFQRDLAKYRKAESAIKACDWPCREPMGNVEGGWPVPQRPTVARQQARDPWGRFAPQHTCGCSQPRQTREVRQKCGIVPVGAVVVDHTWNGEPIFDR